MCLDEQCEFMEETCLNTMPYCIILFAIGLPPPKKNPQQKPTKTKTKATGFIKSGAWNN